MSAKTRQTCETCGQPNVAHYDGIPGVAHRRTVIHRAAPYFRMGDQAPRALALDELLTVADFVQVPAIAHAAALELLRGLLVHQDGEGSRTRERVQLVIDGLDFDRPEAQAAATERLMALPHGASVGATTEHGEG